MYTDAGPDAQMRYHPTVKILGFYHDKSLVNPLTNKLIQELIEHDVYDPAYSELHNGILGIYHAQIEDDGEGTRPISRLFVAYWEGKPIGAGLICRVMDQPNYDHVAHVYVKPEFRKKKTGSQLMRRIYDFNAPGLAMVETEDSKACFGKYKALWWIRKPTQLERNVRSGLRALEGTRWVDAEGSILGSEAIAETLKAQQTLIEELQRKLDRA